LEIGKSKEEGRGKKEEGRGKREEGRRKRENGKNSYPFVLDFRVVLLGIGN
jgi:hypothetical protein